MNNFANRIYSINPSASMSVNQKAKDLINSGIDIINLSIGQPDFNTPLHVKNAAINAINENHTGYISSKGISNLLSSIEKKYKNHSFNQLTKNNIIVTPGVKQALFYLNLCLINPGDEAIIFEPYWVTYLDSLLLCGGKPINISGKEENYFKPDISDIKSKITDKTKYFLFSNPCNPSGAVWNKDELNEIYFLAKKHNLYIISDEIYDSIIFDNLKYTSIGSLEEKINKVITLNGYSKSYSMPGFRIGYIIANETLITQTIKLQETIATCVSSISQFAASNAYDDELFLLNNKIIYEQRRDLLVDGINSIKGLSCVKPKGSFYVFINIKDLRMDSIKASEDMLVNAKVAVVPGIAYGNNFDSYVRASFATSEKKINKAIENLLKYYGKKELHI